MYKSFKGKPAFYAGFVLILSVGLLTGCNNQASETAKVNQPVPSQKTAAAPPPANAPAQAQSAIQSSQAQSAAMQSQANAQGSAMMKAQEAARNH